MMWQYGKIVAENITWSWKASKSRSYFTLLPKAKERCFRISKVDSFDRTQEGLTATLNCFSKKWHYWKIPERTVLGILICIGLEWMLAQSPNILVDILIISEMSLALQIFFQQLSILLTTKHSLLTCPPQTKLRSSPAYLAQILLAPIKG